MTTLAVQLGKSHHLGRLNMGCASSTVAPNKSAGTEALPESPEVTVRIIDSKKVAKINAKSSAEKNVDGVVPFTVKPTLALQSGLEFYEATDNSKNIFAAIKRGNVIGFTEILKAHMEDSNPKKLRINRMIGMWNATPLIVALQYGHKDIANMLLVQHDLGDLNHINEKGASALLYACMEGLTDIVRTLVDLKVDVKSDKPTLEAIYNPSTDKSVICSPFSIAVSNGHQAIVGILIDNGCDVNHIFPFPIMKSIQKPTEENKLNVSFVSGGVIRLTPILLACVSGQLSVVRELLWRKCQCDSTVVDSDKSTVLHHIARLKNNAVEIFRELKKHDLLTDSLLQCVDIQGDSALHVAIDSRQEELVQLLLEEGAQPGRKNTVSGVTPLHVAIKRKSESAVKWLLEYGADPLASDKTGATVLQAAEKLRKDSEIYQEVQRAAEAWQAIRGLSSPRVSKVEESQQQQPTPGVGISTVPTGTSTAAATVPTAAQTAPAASSSSGSEAVAPVEVTDLVEGRTASVASEVVVASIKPIVGPSTRDESSFSSSAALSLKAASAILEQQKLHQLSPSKPQQTESGGDDDVRDFSMWVEETLEKSALVEKIVASEKSKGGILSSAGAPGDVNNTPVRGGKDKNSSINNSGGPDGKVSEVQPAISVSVPPLRGIAALDSNAGSNSNGSGSAPTGKDATTPFKAMPPRQAKPPTTFNRNSSAKKMAPAAASASYSNTGGGEPPSPGRKKAAGAGATGTTSSAAAAGNASFTTPVKGVIARPLETPMTLLSPSGITTEVLYTPVVNPQLVAMSKSSSKKNTTAVVTGPSPLKNRKVTQSRK